ncbi:hypothetical protein CRE_11064 [Caenorhabditis remanei]|uniref:MH2 domain-containing protein n=1 Tax=Caenorhabditis remanei TaxID=31234 RepID=E3M5B7_CAERE|nr:hypothetical protein CRE_11064 [Caenorhabditis remanei]
MCDISKRIPVSYFPPPIGFPQMPADNGQMPMEDGAQLVAKDIARMSVKGVDWWSDAPMPDDVGGFIRFQPNDENQRPTTENQRPAPMTEMTEKEKRDVETFLNYHPTGESKLIVVHPVEGEEIVLEPEHDNQGYWCSVQLNDCKTMVSWREINLIKAYLKSFQKGKPFLTRNMEFVVDSLETSVVSDDKRMALMGLPMSEKGKHNSIKTSFKDGIKVYCTGGTVKVSVLSDVTIFVQSPFWNHANGQDLAAVTRLGSNQPRPVIFTVFDFEQFNNHLERAKQHPPTDKMNEFLQSICGFNVSVSKGFGPDYGNRTIFETCCWLSIKFTDPLLLFDKYYRQYRLAPDEINSRT